MRKLKIGIIILAIVLLGLLVTGVILAWPLLAKFWSELIVPNKEYVLFGGFALAMLWLSTRRWSLLLKIFLGVIAISGVSSLTGVSLVNLCAEVGYQITVSVFLAISFVVMLWKKSTKNVEVVEKEKISAPRKPKGQTIKERWDRFIVGIAGNNKGGSKKIALYVVCAIIIGIVIMPLVVRMVVPLWTMIILPGRDYLLIFALVAISVLLAIFIKKPIINATILCLIISGLSFIYGVTVPEIMSDSWFQLLSVFFVCTLLVQIPFRSDDYNFDITALIVGGISFVLMIIAFILVWKISDIASIFLLVMLGGLGIAGFFGTEGDGEHLSILNIVYCIVIILTMSGVIFSCDKDVEIVQWKAKPAIVQSVETPTEEPTTQAQSIKNERPVQDGVIRVYTEGGSDTKVEHALKNSGICDVTIPRIKAYMLGGENIFQGEVKIRTYADGSVNVEIHDFTSERGFSVREGEIQKSFLLTTSGGNLIIPAGARVELKYFTEFSFNAASSLSCEGEILKLSPNNAVTIPTRECLVSGVERALKPSSSTSFDIPETIIEVFGQPVVLRGDVEIKVDSNGNAHVEIADYTDENNFGTRKGLLNQPLNLKISGGNLVIPAGARIELGYYTNFYFQIPAQ